MADRSSSRRRRSVEDARREILDSARVLLADGGPDAVRVQTVARAVGVTDAAVHYHFGSRDGLLDAVLRDVARQLRADLEALSTAWDAAGEVDIGAELEQLDDAYGRRGYSRLTAWMRLHGWRPRGSGMLRAHAEAVHATRARRAGAAASPLEDTLHLVALLNLVAWAEPLVGREWRQAVGLPATAEATARFRAWLVDLLQRHVDAHPVT